MHSQLYVCVRETIFNFYSIFICTRKGSAKKIKKKWENRKTRGHCPRAGSACEMKMSWPVATMENRSQQPAAIQVLTWSCSPILELESAGSVCQLASRCTCRAAVDVQFAVICRSAWGRKLLLLARLWLPVSQLLSRPVSQAVSQLSPASI